MTENRATAKSLSFEERQALLAQLPDYMVEAIKQAGFAVDRRVQKAIVALMEIRTMLEVMYRFSLDGDMDALDLPSIFGSLLKILPDAETDGGLLDIDYEVYDTALPILAAYLHVMPFGQATVKSGQGNPEYHFAQFGIKPTSRSS